MIRLGAPSITAGDIEAVANALRTGNLVQGKEVAAFESELAGFLGVKHVVAMSNCTSALAVALAALGVGRGDLVITTSYSWIATANVVELLGAEPRFVDIDPATLNLDIDDLRARVQNLTRSGDIHRVKALMPVHAFGYAADLDELEKIASDLGIPMIEDAACALGAEYGGRLAGTVGAIGCFSFHPRKSITTGEGGALATDDQSIADFARSFRNHGQDVGRLHSFVDFGHNYRLTEPMAALGRSQFARLPQLLERRREVMALYIDRLRGVVGVPRFDPRRHAAQAFVAMLPAGVDRSRVIEQLAERGVEAGTGTIPIPFTQVFRTKYGFENSDFPELSRVMERLIALPLHSELSIEDAEFVANALLAVLTSETC